MSHNNINVYPQVYGPRCVFLADMPLPGGQFNEGRHGRGGVDHSRHVHVWCVFTMYLARVLQQHVCPDAGRPGVCVLLEL